MSLLDFYFHLPVWLQNVALSAYGLHLRRLRYGSEHTRTLESLMSEQWYSEDEIEFRQRRRLAATLKHAATSVPYYRELGLPIPIGPDDALEVLAEWPLLEKSHVQAAGRAMISDLHRNEPLTEIHTGGTTGRALRIWCDRSTLQRSYAFFERLKRWAGVSSRDRVATFAGRPIVPPGASAPPYWRRNFASNQLLCSSYHISPDSVEDYLFALERFRPAMIDSYPSSIEPLARAIVDRGGSDFRVRAVVTSSETLFPESRSLIENAFRCPVYDHYGSAEMVAFISQCSEGPYHPNPEYGFLEVLRPNGNPVASGEEGEIVATGFINRAMPLIRYRMGDLATLGEATCNCGRSFPIVRQISGRVDDVVVTPDGRRVGRLDPIFKAVDSLFEARIVQTAIDAVRLEVVAGTSFGESDRRELREQLKLRLGPRMTIEIAKVDSIERTQSGKLRTVVSPYAEGGGESP